jgi:hypothetical protein
VRAAAFCRRHCRYSLVLRRRAFDASSATRGVDIAHTSQHAHGHGEHDHKCGAGCQLPAAVHDTTITTLVLEWTQNIGVHFPRAAVEQWLAATLWNPGELCLAPLSARPPQSRTLFATALQTRSPSRTTRTAGRCSLRPATKRCSVARSSSTRWCVDQRSFSLAHARAGFVWRGGQNEFSHDEIDLVLSFLDSLVTHVVWCACACVPSATL